MDIHTYQSIRESINCVRKSNFTESKGKKRIALKAALRGK